MGAEPNLQDKFGNSCLHMAIQAYLQDLDRYIIYKGIVKLLLKSGASREL